MIFENLTAVKAVLWQVTHSSWFIKIWFWKQIWYLLRLSKNFLQCMFTWWFWWWEVIKINERSKFKLFDSICKVSIIFHFLSLRYMSLWLLTDSRSLIRQHTLNSLSNRIFISEQLTCLHFRRWHLKLLFSGLFLWSLSFYLS